jgi:hypothetical protein
VSYYNAVSIAKLDHNDGLFISFLRRFKFDKVKPRQNNKEGSKMKASMKFVMIYTILVISLGVALAENGNMAKNMTMSSNMTMPMNMSMCMAMPMNMTMPMKMPMNTASGSTNVIVLQNVTLNIILAQNLTEVTK